MCNMPYEGDDGEPKAEVTRLRNQSPLVRHLEEILSRRGPARQLVEARVVRAWVHAEDRETRMGRREVLMELIFQGESFDSTVGFFTVDF